MIPGLYVHGTSTVHRLPAAAKLAALAAVGTAAIAVSDWRWLMLGLAGIALLYAAARIPLRIAIGQIRPALVLLTAILLVQGLVTDWSTGLSVSLRFALLILCAALVTLTTRQSAMVEAVSAAAGPLRHLGLDPARIGLALSLSIRFIPLIAEQAAIVREAQRARGLDRSLIALAVPLIVHVLKMADDLAEAIDARSFDADEV